MFVTTHRFSLAAASGVHSLVAVCRLLIAGASLAAEHGHQATRVQQQQLSGLVALWNVQSSRTRDRTGVSCIGKLILNHWKFLIY